MKTKRTNPYTSLLKEIKAFVQKLKYRHTVSMFCWSADKLTPENSWRLDEVYQRCKAAKSLGYEVVIEADEKGLVMKYKKTVDVPWSWEN